MVNNRHPAHLFTQDRNRLKAGCCLVMPQQGHQSTEPRSRVSGAAAVEEKPVRCLLNKSVAHTIMDSTEGL